MCCKKAGRENGLIEACDLQVRYATCQPYVSETCEVGKQTLTTATMTTHIGSTEPAFFPSVDGNGAGEHCCLLHL